MASVNESSNDLLPVYYDRNGGIPLYGDLLEMRALLGFSVECLVRASPGPKLLQRAEKCGGHDVAWT